MRWARDFVKFIKENLFLLKRVPKVYTLQDLTKPGPTLEPEPPLSPQALLGQKQVLGPPCLLTEAFSAPSCPCATHPTPLNAQLSG